MVFFYYKICLVSTCLAVGSILPANQYIALRINFISCNMTDFMNQCINIVFHIAKDTMQALEM